MCVLLSIFGDYEFRVSLLPNVIFNGLVIVSIQLNVMNRIEFLKFHPQKKQR